MLTNGYQIEIDGKTIDLLLNTEALAVIVEKWGGIDKALEQEYADKVRIVPEMLSILANAAEEYKESGYQYSPKWFSVHTTPGDYQAITDAINMTYARGMKVELPEPENEEEETDEVLDQIQKNAQGAAGK